MKARLAVTLLSMLLVFGLGLAACTENPETKKRGGDEDISNLEQPSEGEQITETEGLVETETEQQDKIGEEDSPTEIPDLPDQESEPQQEIEQDIPTEQDTTAELEDPCAACDPETQVCYGGECRDLHAPCIGDDMCLPCQQCINNRCEGEPCLEDGDVDPDPDITDIPEWEQPDLEVADEGFRFTSLIWQEPVVVINTGYGQVDLNQMFNQQVGQQIANYNLNVLFMPESGAELLSYPYDIVFADASKNQDNTYSINNQLVQFEINQDDSQQDVHYFKSASTDFYIPFQGIYIHLRETTVYGKYTDGLDQIEEGIIAGALPRNDARQIGYGGFTLDQLIEMSRMAGNTVHTTTLEDGTEAWVFIYLYEAREKVQVTVGK